MLIASVKELIRCEWDREMAFKTQYKLELCLDLLSYQ